MSQVKIPEDVKREIELVAGITGRSQGELVAESWREYRQRHEPEFQEGLRRASALLANPIDAAVAASGMTPDQLAEIEEAFGDD